MDYDENMIAMMNAATPEAIKRVEIGQGTHECIVHDLNERIARLETDAREAYARGRREAIEEAAGLARLMFPHGAAAFVAELTKGPRRGQ